MLVFNRSVLGQAGRPFNDPLADAPMPGSVLAVEMDPLPDNCEGVRPRRVLNLRAGLEVRDSTVY